MRSQSLCQGPELFCVGLTLTESSPRHENTYFGIEDLEEHLFELYCKRLR